MNFGTALAGMGNAQPQIMAMRQEEDKKRQQAMIAQAIMQGGAPPPQMPQGAPPPQGPMPGGAPMPAPPAGAPPQPSGQPPMPSNQALAQPVQPQGGAQGALPDFNQFLSKINTMPGTGADKGAAIMQLLPMYAQQWSVQNEQNYKQQQLALDKIKVVTGEQRADADTKRADAAEQRADAADKHQEEVEKNQQWKEWSDDKKQLEGEVESARKDADSFVNAGKINGQDYKDAKALLSDKRKELDELKKNKPGDAPRAAPAAKKSPNEQVKAAAGGEVTVISPDGQEGTIPAGQLKDALAAGYKQK